MNYPKQNAFSKFRFVISLLALTIICSTPALVKAERPDVQWMRGGHANNVRSMDYSPDGQLFVSIGDSYGLVKIWRLSDGLMLRSLPLLSPGASYSEKVVFLPDSQTIAVFDNSTSEIRIARVSDGAIIKTIVVGGNVGATNLKVLSDGTIFLATAGSGVRYYRLSDGALIKTVTGAYYLNAGGIPQSFHNGIVGKAYPLNNGNIAVSLSFGNNGGAYPAIISSSDIVSINNNSFGRLVGYHPSETFGMNGATNDGAFIISPNGGNNLSRIYQTSNLCPSPTANCNASLIPIVASIQANGDSEFSPNGQTFAMKSNGLKLFRTSDWTLLQTIQNFNITPFLFSPNNQVVAIGGEVSVSDRVPLINFWSVADGTLTGILNSHFGSVTATVFSPDRQTFATATDYNGSGSFSYKPLRLWRVSDGAFLRSIVPPNGVSSVAFSPTGQSLAIVNPNTTSLWQTSNGTLIRDFGSGSGGSDVAFSPNGQYIFTTTGKMYEVATGNLVRTLNCSGYSVTISPDGQTVAFGGQMASLCRVSNSTLIRSISIPNSSGRYDAASVAFAPDSQSIIVGVKEGISDRTSRIRQYRISDGTLLQTFIGHVNWIYSVAFSPQGDTIISGGGDGVRVWRVSDGAQLNYYDEETIQTAPTYPGTNVLSVAFSPDGSRFAWGRIDATAVMANNPYYVPQFKVSGQVTVGGAALADATVVLRGTFNRVTATDEAGNYSFPNAIPNGNFNVAVYKSGYLFDPANQTRNNISSNQTADFSGSPLCAPGVCPNSVNTPAQNNLTIALASNLSMTYGTVTMAGSTVATPLALNQLPQLPLGYGTIPESVFTDIRTSAIFTNSTLVKFVLPNSVDQTTFNQLRILHFENGGWFDATILAPDSPAPDFNTRTIYARVSSLSPFVVAGQFAPTAASVTVGGRVTTADRDGIRHARVTMTDSSGNSQTVLTGRFGAYRFSGVAAGETYVFSVAARRFTFSRSSEVRTVNEDLTDIDFVADEN